VLTQKIEFLESDLEGKNAALAEAKSQHERMVRAMDDASSEEQMR
jgi:hypothetical protein